MPSSQVVIECTRIQALETSVTLQKIIKICQSES